MSKLFRIGGRVGAKKRKVQDSDPDCNFTDFLDISNKPNEPVKIGSLDIILIAI